MKYFSQISARSCCIAGMVAGLFVVLVSAGARAEVCTEIPGSIRYCNSPDRFSVFQTLADGKNRLLLAEDNEEPQRGPLCVLKLEGKRILAFGCFNRTAKVIDYSGDIKKSAEFTFDTGGGRGVQNLRATEFGFEFQTINSAQVSAIGTRQLSTTMVRYTVDDALEVSRAEVSCNGNFNARLSMPRLHEIPFCLFQAASRPSDVLLSVTPTPNLDPTFLR